MVPSVAGIIMWRRGEPAAWQAFSPIRLTLKLRAMTGGTMLTIDFRAYSNLRRIARIGALVIGASRVVSASTEHADKNKVKRAHAIP